jgi:hypothetical protein
MINKENVLKLAAFIEGGTVPWNMRETDQCFFGQYTAMHGGAMADDVIGFLGVKGPDTSLLVTPPDFSTRPDDYPKERAVQMLHRLAETGEVDWG